MRPLYMLNKIILLEKFFVASVNIANVVWDSFVGFPIVCIQLYLNIIKRSHLRSENFDTSCETLKTNYVFVSWNQTTLMTI